MGVMGHLAAPRMRSLSLLAWRQAQVWRESRLWFAAICVAPRDSQAYEAAVARLAEAREKKLDELEAAARRSNRVRGDDSPEPLRYDEELGMPIYSLDALKIGQGKDTAQCPFDCECCF